MNENDHGGEYIDTFRFSPFSGQGTLPNPNNVGRPDVAPSNKLLLPLLRVPSLIHG